MKPKLYLIFILRRIFLGNFSKSSSETILIIIKMRLFLTLINLILNQQNVCFCCRYILGGRKLKKTTFPFTSGYEQQDDWKLKWRQLVEKYGLDRIKTHLVKVRQCLSGNQSLDC